MVSHTLTEAMTNRSGMPYLGVILNADDQERLLRWWKVHRGPLFKNHRGHHMTIRIKPSESDIAKAALGKNVDLTVTGVIDAEGTQAVVVKSNISHSVTPHITVSFDDGKSAKDSANGEIESVKPFKLSGRIGYVNDGGEEIFEHR